MNADKRRLKTKNLSAFICVYPRLICLFQQPVRLGGLAGAPPETRTWLGLLNSDSDFGLRGWFGPLRLRVASTRGRGKRQQNQGDDAHSLRHGQSSSRNQEYQATLLRLAASDTGRPRTFQCFRKLRYFRLRYRRTRRLFRQHPRQPCGRGAWAPATCAVGALPCRLLKPETGADSDYPGKCHSSTGC
jgi:hypothetical protein